MGWPWPQVDSLYRVIKLGARSFGNNDLWRLLETEVKHVLGWRKEFRVEPKPLVEGEWLVGWLVGEVNKQNLMWEYMYGIKNVGESFGQEKHVELHSLFFWG